MARYIGPKTRISRKFREPIYGPDKNFDKRSYPPGQHGQNKKRSKVSEYAVQLMEKQKVKSLSVSSLRFLIAHQEWMELQVKTY